MDRLAEIRERWTGVKLLIIDEEGPLAHAPADIRYLLALTGGLLRRIDELERRLYARPRYLGERRS